MISVLIVDDEPLVRAGLHAILESQSDFEVVGEAEDGGAAIELVRQLLPDVVVMDIRMTGMDGIEATREIASIDEPPRVLVVTTFDLDEYVYEAMQAGASGFLLKDAPREQLFAAIRGVLSGDVLLAPAITRRLIERFMVRTPEKKAAAESLSEREKQVLRLVAQGLSNAEIAASLFLSESTIKTHVANVLQKLNLRDRVQAVVYAYESGFAEPGEFSGT